MEKREGDTGMIPELAAKLPPSFPDGLRPALHVLLIGLVCLAVLFLSARVLGRCLGRPPADDIELIRRAARLDSDWQVIWTAVAAPTSMEHLCAGPVGRADSYHGQRVRLRYVPTAIPGVEVAKCAHCHLAWVRAVAGQDLARGPHRASFS